ncbi:Glypican-3 [Liparis tanakae]|uniref:Glypican-3 n=1 Tax=Liparis tanakae TaxID=230148 RepID=A0A4Z2GE49_9TELE|nr:Glypican-3 [Liparis tanakae]
MLGVSVRGALFLCASLQLFSLPSAQVPTCQEVRTVFQSLHPGSKWVPETPVSEHRRSGRSSSLLRARSDPEDTP